VRMQGAFFLVSFPTCCRTAHESIHVPQSWNLLVC
jgi:hypothetical protein